MQAEHDGVNISGASSLQHLQQDLVARQMEKNGVTATESLNWNWITHNVSIITNVLYKQWCSFENQDSSIYVAHCNFSRSPDRC